MSRKAQADLGLMPLSELTERFNRRMGTSLCECAVWNLLRRAERKVADSLRGVSPNWRRQQHLRRRDRQMSEKRVMVNE